MHLLVASARVLRAVVLVPLCLSLGGCVSALTLGQTVAVLNAPGEFHARERMYLHEEIHRAQYRRAGTLRMLMMYLLSPSHRLDFEAEAYAAELCYVERVGTAHLAAWKDAFAKALVRYSPPPGLSSEQAHRRLARAYADGAQCARLLSSGSGRWAFLSGVEGGD